MKDLKTILGWAALAVLVLFIVINWKYEPINIVYITYVDMPLSLVILVSAVLGWGFARLTKKSPPKS